VLAGSADPHSVGAVAYHIASGLANADLACEVKSERADAIIERGKYAARTVWAHVVQSG
jgi:hypothetical protein